MSASTEPGTANTYQAGGLRGFEDDDLDEAIIAPPPRRRRNQRPGTSGAPASAPQPTAPESADEARTTFGPSQHSTPAPSMPVPYLGQEKTAAELEEQTTSSGSPGQVTPAAQPDTAQSSRQPDQPQTEDVPAAPAPVTTTPARAKGRTRGPKSKHDPADPVQPSNVHIPVRLLKGIEEQGRRKGLSHGELIIDALETLHPRLGELVNPVATAGGSLFAARRGRKSRIAEGPLTALNYRLRESDFAIIDQLVEEFHASSRGHLITAALTEYLQPSQEGKGS